MDFAADFGEGAKDMFSGYGLAVLLFVFLGFVVLALIPRNPIASPTATASTVRTKYNQLVA